MAKKRTNPDERLGRWAEKHLGLVPLDRALRVGLTSRQVQLRARRGRLVRVRHGVYRVNGAPVTADQQAYAAVLAAGPAAVVGGLSALALFRLVEAPKQPRLTVPPLASARTPGAIVLRSPLSSADRTHVGPIPCTTVPRALVEVARDLDQAHLDDLVDSAIHRDLASTSAILGAIRRAPAGWGRAGADNLRRALHPWLGTVAAESPGEARLLRRLLEWGLPEPERQHPVELGPTIVRLDVAWPDHLVGLEYDGEEFHGPRRLAADEQREAALRARGWWIGRVDRHDLAPSSTRLLDELRPRLLVPAA
ncbi:MAG TPA: type IV toxin-antitoxin system AbiEi family antitoxin domain-containing protein [Acidimicrobiales bacterium]|nr:type IV toxin-antitoxin system AbiEi family antitoxin domain-containing protein [Acidimicrobiales bacterium]